MDKFILSLKRASSLYTSVIGVHEINLTIGYKERVGLIGPNGAGKTTLFNMITGYRPITEGVIYFEDRDITRLSPERRISLGLGRSFQQATIFGSMSILDNIAVAILSRENKEYNCVSRINKRIYGEALDRAREIGFSEDLAKPAQDLSLGDQKRLEVALAIASEPKLLLLDEPAAGMSEAETGRMLTLIENVQKRRGIAVLFTEHDMKVVFRLAERLLVLDGGRLVAEGPPEEIRKNPKVQELYFGGRR